MGKSRNSRKGTRKGLLQSKGPRPSRQVRSRNWSSIDSCHVSQSAAPAALKTYRRIDAKLEAKNWRRALRVSAKE